MTRSAFILTAVITFLFSCKPSETRVQASYLDGGDEKYQELDPYWYQGKAEVSTYEISQNRYQDVHPGEVVLVFVTEDFLKDKQVKNDRYSNPNSIGILKTNKIKRFTTGIYDYSIMTSVFTPTERSKYPHTLKTTCASQDWCGQTYQQLNLEKNKYKSTLHSYFEDEADDISYSEVAVLEDELLPLIRINPDLLPVGKFKMIPSSEYLRLRHRPFGMVNAVGSQVEFTGNPKMMIYQVKVEDEEKTIEIVYEKEAPYKIQGWTISYPSAFDGKVRKTVATKKGEKYIPYWKNNGADEAESRKELKLIY